MTESLKPEMSEIIAKRTIKISSPDLGALLIDFLSEVLYLIQTNKEIYTNINFKKLTDTELEGKLTGTKTKRFGEDIKAVTYHNLDIRQEKDGTWEATILFDI
jgi:SHS2 domain-containing protein